MSDTTHLPLPTATASVVSEKEMEIVSNKISNDASFAVCGSCVRKSTDFFLSSTWLYLQLGSVVLVSCWEQPWQGSASFSWVIWWFAKKQPVAIAARNLSKARVFPFKTTFAAIYQSSDYLGLGPRIPKSEITTFSDWWFCRYRRLFLLIERWHSGYSCERLQPGSITIRDMFKLAIFQDILGAKGHWNETVYITEQLILLLNNPGFIFRWVLFNWTFWADCGGQ